ncbi:hypothetical protein ACVBGC_15185 [Burkholderia stagnalis]
MIGNALSAMHGECAARCRSGAATDRVALSDDRQTKAAFGDRAALVVEVRRDPVAQRVARAAGCAEMRDPTVGRDARMRERAAWRRRQRRGDGFPDDASRMLPDACSTTPRFDARREPVASSYPAPLAHRHFSTENVGKLVDILRTTRLSP